MSTAIKNRLSAIELKMQARNGTRHLDPLAVRVPAIIDDTKIEKLQIEAAALGHPLYVYTFDEYPAQQGYFKDWPNRQLPSLYALHSHIDVPHDARDSGIEYGLRF